MLDLTFLKMVTANTVKIKSNVNCIQYDVKHNLVLDGILVY